jgi:hypothetical protein
MSLDRRGLLLGTSALFVAGCAAPKSSQGTSATSPSSSTSAASAANSSVPATMAAAASQAPAPAPQPTTGPWSADGNEIQGAVKLVATRMIETLGTWDASTAGVAAAGARLSALGIDPALASQAADLLAGGVLAKVQVIDAQYGGLLASSASVLIPTRQWVISQPGAVTQRGWTFDVRLSAAVPSWRVTAINPSAPGPAAAVDSLATQVLNSSRIDLPPASRADIASGQVHDSVLRAVLGLAKTYMIGVSVIRSGHPTYVFGTTRLSDHPRGRAFDTWRINGMPVVAASTPRSLVTGYMTAAAGLGSYNVGGPYVLNGSVYFSDQTHHDHVHAGFST